MQVCHVTLLPSMTRTWCPWDGLAPGLALLPFGFDLARRLWTGDGDARVVACVLLLAQRWN